MKTKHLLFSFLFCGAAAVCGSSANAQEVVVEQQAAAITENVQCKDYVASNWRNNWFLEVGAGVNIPLMENYLPGGNQSHKANLAMNLGLGHWFSPYLGVRINALGGKYEWDAVSYNNSAKYASLNVDLMWDMFNSLGGINTERVFSIAPFVGIGGAFAWDLNSASSNIMGNDLKIKTNSFALPVSAGMKFSFRVSKYVDIFAEGRFQFFGDNFNGCAYGDPIDVNFTGVAGLTFNFGGKKFDTMNPCTYLNYINQLNGQVNNLRSELASTAAALAAAEAQLPCPEVKEVECPEQVAPMLAAVRFNLNSSKINKTEMTNVYNIAEWMKANPSVKLVINGYADKNTGTSEYNAKLSEKRAQRVFDQLAEYGVEEDRMEIDAHGSAVQPYADKNNWNRIVLFTTK